MSQIKACDTKLELVFAKTLRKYRVKGYRRRYALLGKPDFTFPKKKVAVFLDGCFWHKCPKCYRKPATNADFWKKKIANNMARDSKVNSALRKKGWKVKRFWGHQIKKTPERVAIAMRRFLFL